MAEIAGTPTAPSPHKAESNVTVHEAHDGTLLRGSGTQPIRPGGRESGRWWERSPARAPPTGRTP
ncbi:hypothetical protein Sliba_69280 [Streptomyces nigrescens]|uniref:Uncharacterized protein n=1 Tax=Streptomyces nigrescens TaxID=1920 RepID=A0A640TWJ6_STRNI|nr:hypothetical protein Sliba_69280 [Streptomyces libani subsp. libani]GGW07179.1 hypothetical protein GCM10010500_75360 [Streptomyces libani subsp. libani]